MSMYGAMLGEMLDLSSPAAFGSAAEEWMDTLRTQLERISQDLEGLSVGVRGVQAWTVDEVFRKLRTRVWSKEDQHTDGNCVICIGDFCLGEEVVQVPRCGHTFHRECLCEWIERQKCCPVCRLDLLTLLPANYPSTETRVAPHFQDQLREIERRMTELQGQVRVLVQEETAWQAAIQPTYVTSPTAAPWVAQADNSWGAQTAAATGSAGQQRSRRCRRRRHHQQHRQPESQTEWWDPGHYSYHSQAGSAAPWTTHQTRRWRHPASI